MMDFASKASTEMKRNTMHTPISTRLGTCQRASAPMMAEGDNVNSAHPAVNGGTMCMRLTKNTP